MKRKPTIPQEPVAAPPEPPKEQYWELGNCLMSYAEDTLRTVFLRDGWEPFAVSGAYIWFRRRVSA